MLKYPIKFQNFDGVQCTQELYFNMSKAELVELEVTGEGGSFGDHLQRIIAAGDKGKLIVEFKKLVLASYGEKSADGMSFVKNDQLREAFSQTAAYQELFMLLATNDAEASKFITGIIPKDLEASLQAIAAKQTMPPPPPQVVLDPATAV